MLLRGRRAVDEAVVEVRAVGELDVVHLLQQSAGRGAFPDGQQGHLGALARHVARADDAQGRDVRHEADAHGAGRGQVAAERAREENLLDVRGGEPHLLEQQPPARGDGRLGELQLAHVALGQVDRPAHVAAGAGPVQHEDTLFPDLAQPVGQLGTGVRGGLGVQQPAGRVQQLGLHQRGDGVDQAGAAEPDRLHVADHLQAHVVVADLDAFDGAAGGPHPAADRGAFERRARGRRGGQQPVGVRERRSRSSCPRR